MKKAGGADAIANNRRWGINLHSESSTTNQTYNNSFYIEGLGSGDLVRSSGGSTHLNSLNPGSSAVGAGTNMADNGGADYWGNALYQGQHDIGPGERL